MADHSQTRSANQPAMIFASLTAADLRTNRGMDKVLDSIYAQSSGLAHHQNFIRHQAGALAATRSPTVSPEPCSSGSGCTTEAGQSDDGSFSFSTAACYILHLDEAKRPYNPNLGYWFGIGDLARFPEHAGVDLLLPPSSLADPLQVSLSNKDLVSSRHGYFAFDPTYAQLWLHARHSGIRVDDRPLAAGLKILMAPRARIAIGPYRYIFEFHVPDETAFQVAKAEYLFAFRGGAIPHESTSATPSANDVRIQDWRLHGVVGTSPVTVIHAATNVRSGAVVAVKRLRFGSSRTSAEAEVEVYDRILSNIRGHRYSSFVMRKHSILSNEPAYTSVHEVYLLWEPLARGDFQQFGVHGRWHTEPRMLKMSLFVQVLLGLSALHDNGWIHRDLKPANLGVVELGDKPHAIIMDEASAIPEAREGHVPRIAHCGTIGYLAPELENKSFAPTYDRAVDIWSMGAVAYFLFFSGKIPWSSRVNMFVPEKNARDPTLHLFREIRAKLISEPEETLEHLTGQMLHESPRERPNISRILEHSAIQEVLETIHQGLEARRSAGQKRGRDT